MRRIPTKANTRENSAVYLEIASWPTKYRICVQSRNQDGESVKKLAASSLYKHPGKAA